MEALKDINPETKISDLTVEQFEAVMTRALCRVADFAAVRFAQEQMYVNDVSLPTELRDSFLNARSSGTKQVRDQIAGENWPEFKTACVKTKEDLEVEL